MRRRLGRFLPIFLIAVAVQLLAPIGVCMAASVAIADPLHGGALCSGGAGGSEDAPGTLPHSRDGSCSACCTAANAPPLAPVLTITPVERQSYRVAWRAFLPGSLAARVTLIAQPRGPPTLS